jgi:hypothetical protein
VTGTPVGDPEVIGEYRVLRRLGAGGMGEVFLVQHPRLPRRDAMKLLNSQFSGDGNYAARFRREADVLAGLQHPNIVTVHDRGEHHGRLWLAMEYVDGADAAQLVRSRGPLPAPMVAEIIDRVGSALDTAWEVRGLTHRDVKPANILLAFRGDRLVTVKLVDFGIAKTGDDVSALTGTGIAVGTMNYLSPEGIEGKPVDNRADLYSLACTAFELLTGTPPFAAGTPSAVMMAHLTAPVPDPAHRVAGLPPGLAAVFARAMAKRPADRYRNCGEFGAAFRGALSGGPSPSGNPTVTRPTPPVYPQTTVATPPPSYPMPTYPQPAPASGGNRPLLIAVGVLAVVALIAVGGYLWLTSGTKTADTASTPTTVTVPATAAATDTAGATTASVAPTPTVPGTDQYGFVGNPARCTGGEQLEFAMRTAGSGGGSLVVICSVDGAYTYHGARSSGDASGITLSASRSGSGFVASNNASDGGGTTTYRVDPTTGLTITGPGVAVAEPVTSVWSR